MLENPKCKECGDNKRVIFSRKQPRPKFLMIDLMMNFFNGDENYQCNACGNIFKGRQKARRCANAN